MSKSVLTSINPPHTNNIFAEIKQIEWRLRPLPMGTHYCYETKKCFGRGKVIGQYEICRVEKFEDINLIPKKYIDSGCVPVEFLEAYSKGKPLYANFIASPKLYDKPKELSEFRLYNVRAYYDEELKLPMPTHEITRPPQSWCYVEDMEGKK